MSDAFSLRRLLAWLFVASAVAAAALPATFRGHAFDKYVSRPLDPKANYGLLWTDARRTTEATLFVATDWNMVFPGGRDGAYASLVTQSASLQGDATPRDSTLGAVAGKWKGLWADLTWQSDWDLLAWAGVVQAALLLVAALLALDATRRAPRHSRPSHRLAVSAAMSLGTSIAFWLTSMVAIYKSDQVPLPSPLGFVILGTWVAVAITAQRIASLERPPAPSLVNPA